MPRVEVNGVNLHFELRGGEGGQSPSFLPVIMDRLAAALSQTQRATFAEAGHVPHWSHPARYASVVAEFILEPRRPPTQA